MVTPTRCKARCAKAVGLPPACRRPGRGGPRHADGAGQVQARRPQSTPGRGL